MPFENDVTMTVFPARGNEPLTESDAAVRLGLKIATLRAWRHQGRGPTFVRLGRAIRYLPSDLEEFLRTNRRSPVSNSAK